MDTLPIYEGSRQL